MGDMPDGGWKRREIGGEVIVDTESLYRKVFTTFMSP